MALEFEDLTGKIIGAAIAVHRKLGPGFLESVYERALVIELQKRGLKFEQQKEIVVLFDGVEVGKHRLDLFIEKRNCRGFKNDQSISRRSLCHSEIAVAGRRKKTRSAAELRKHKSRSGSFVLRSWFPDFRAS
jgi:GxxExxY protein